MRCWRAGSPSAWCAAWVRRQISVMAFLHNVQHGDWRFAALAGIAVAAVWNFALSRASSGDAIDDQRQLPIHIQWVKLLAVRQAGRPRDRIEQAEHQQRKARRTILPSPDSGPGRNACWKAIGSAMHRKMLLGW